MHVASIIQLTTLTLVSLSNSCFSDCIVYGRSLEKYMRKDPKNLEFIYKKLYILTCLNFDHLQSTLHLIKWDSFQDFFFHCSKQFLKLILMPFNASAIFCFTCFTLAKSLPLKTYFIWGNQIKSLGGRTRPDE